MTVHVTFHNIPTDRFNDDNYDRTEEIVKEGLKRIADDLSCTIEDIEIK